MSDSLKTTLHAFSYAWLNEADLHTSFNPNDTTQSAAPLMSHATAGMDVLDAMAEHNNTMHHVWYSLNDDVQHLKERDADEDMDRHDWAELYPDIVQAVHDGMTLLGL